MKRETTIRLNVRERPTGESIQDAVQTLVRPWFDAIEAEGLTYAAPIFTLTPDPTDPWTTHIHVATDTHPTSPSAQCRGEGCGGAVSERGE